MGTYTERELREAGLQAPRVAELRADPEPGAHPGAGGQLVRIYLPEQIEELLARLGDLPERFTVAAFRGCDGADPQIRGSVAGMAGRLRDDRLARR